MPWCLASVCTLLSGTCVPELRGLDRPQQRREGDRQRDRRQRQEQRQRVAQQQPARACGEVAQCHQRRVAAVSQAGAHGHLARTAAAGAVAGL